MHQSEQTTTVSNFDTDIARIELWSTTTNTSRFDTLHSGFSHSQPVKYEFIHHRTSNEMKSHMSLYVLLSHSLITNNFI